jgi:hypothetical protein
MTHKSLTKPKVTDIERHDRFVAMTQKIGALDDVKNFEKAFQKPFKSAFDNAARWKRPTGDRTNGGGAQRRLIGD